MNRRQFMQGILATACAPAIVRADSLMRIVARDTTIVLPENLFLDWFMSHTADEIWSPGILRILNDRDAA